ncbi:hypothetical protein HDV00_010078 [Rhizophlyctis rosea]|nr:hypothetical protein HDV00_010078 [Rhizophlyctis rosea]
MTPAGKVVMRERSASERLGSANQADQDRRQRTMSENREAPGGGRLARRTSFGERDVVLPAIAVQPPSRKSSTALTEQATMAAVSQAASRRTHGRQRSTSASGQQPVILPPVPGAVPASGLSPKTSASSLGGGPQGTDGAMGSSASVGSNVGVYELANSENSLEREPSTGSDETPRRNRSTSGSQRRQRSERSYGETEEPTNDRHAAAPRSAGKRVSSAEARRARLERPWTGHARLQDVNENDASASNTLPRSGSVPSNLANQQNFSEQVAARLRETSVDASRTNLDSLPGSTPVLATAAADLNGDWDGREERDLDEEEDEIPFPSVPSSLQSQQSQNRASPLLVKALQNQQSLPTTPGNTLHPSHPSHIPAVTITADTTSVSSHDSSPTTTLNPAVQASLLALQQGALKLHRLEVQVVGTNFGISEKGKEVLKFVISVKDAERGGAGELWRIEKTYADFLGLDAKLKANQPKTTISKIGKLPDKALFNTHAPSKSDQRKVALELYLQNVKSVCRDSADLQEFLSTDLVESGKGENVKPPSIVKEGYLFKKGKNFGGWKTRWFVLHDRGVLEYYESQKDKALLRSIKLKYVFVSRQSTSTAQQIDNEYRHAFILTEFDKEAFRAAPSPDQFSESKVIGRHILCAETDEERDDWVKCCGAVIQRLRPGGGGAQRVITSNLSVTATVVGASDASLASLGGMTSGGEEGGSWGREKGAGGMFRGLMRGKESGETAVMERDDEEEDEDEAEEEGGKADTTLSTEGTLERGMIYPTPTAASPSPPPATGYGNGMQPYMQPPTYPGGISPNPSQTFPATGAGGAALTSQQPPYPMMMGQSSGMVPPTSPSPQRVIKNYVDDNERVMQQPLPPPLVADNEERIKTADAAMSSLSSKDVATNRKAKRVTAAFSWAKRKAGAAPGGGGGEGGKEGGAAGAGGNVRKVFGVPLDVAVAVSRVKEGYELPAVVYRCIEYLDAKKAADEEGIYRLSGSTTTIQALRERFNNEGDVDLLGSGMYYDVHAIAGLLKMYLRELPSPILTKELRDDFLRITDLNDRNDRIAELTRLVALLPLPNYTLMRSLIAHLIRVVQNSDKNRMTVKNMGIVFSPTLQVPAGVFTLMMAEYESVFMGIGVPVSSVAPPTPGRTSRVERGEDVDMREVNGGTGAGAGGGTESPATPVLTPHAPHPPRGPHSASKRRSRAASASRGSTDHAKGGDVAMGEAGLEGENQGRKAENSPGAGEEADVDEELPVPKRRQANSAKRRARAEAGRGFRMGMEFDGSGIPGFNGTGAMQQLGAPGRNDDGESDSEGAVPVAYVGGGRGSAAAAGASNGNVSDSMDEDGAPIISTRNSTSYMESAPESVLAYEDSVRGGVEDDNDSISSEVEDMAVNGSNSYHGSKGKRHSEAAGTVESDDEVIVDGESDREYEVASRYSSGTNRYSQGTLGGKHFSVVDSD